MYMDIQVKISLQLIIQNAETVAYVRQTKLNKNDFSFIDRLILMCIVCSRQCLIEKLVFSLFCPYISLLLLPGGSFLIFFLPFQ